MANMESITRRTNMETQPQQVVDFSNTEIAFSNKSDKELKKTAWLFKMMSKNALVNVGSQLGLIAVKLRLPFVETIIKNTIFEQFCGGQNLMDCQSAIDHLYKYNVLTILDYGAEGKSTEDDFNQVSEELIKAIEMAAANESVPVVSSKLSALADNDLMAKVQSDKPLTPGEQQDYQKFKDRIDSMCSRANELGVGVMIDAEESWIQVTIDNIVYELMEKYNKEKCIVYNTYQLYRKDKLNHLKRDHLTAQKKGYVFGAKLVRGAYMNKERSRAEDMGYPSPIQDNKKDTDRDFNLAIKYCIDNYETMASCCATHNAESNMYQAELIAERELDRSHPHFNFSQLYGMSDNITFNLAEAGFNVAKYVPYGPIKEVIPYLIRRAQENTSVTGEMSRELADVIKEVKRRGL
jgi:proline dehydrogenase